MEEWIKFHCDLNEFTLWTTQAEELLADALAPDGEKARAHQKVSALHHRMQICY